MSDSSPVNRFQTAFAVSCLLASVGLLAGCQNEKDDGNPIIVGDLETDTNVDAGGVVSATFPTVVSAIPSLNAKDVELGSSLQLIFSEDLLATTVNATTLTLTDPDGETIAVNIAFDGSRTVVLTPSSPLKALTTYLLTVSTGLTDQQGDAVEEEIEVSFTTRDGAWQTAETIEFENAGAATLPVVDFDAEGNAMVVWQQEDSLGVSSVWVNQYVIGKGWQSPTEIDGSNADAANASIASDDAGNALAIWLKEEVDGSHSLWANGYLVDDESWGEASAFENANGNVESAALDVSANGRAIVAWTQVDEDGNTNVYARHIAVDEEPGDIVLLDALEGTGAPDASAAPQVSVDAQGNAVVVWEQLQDDGFVGIWASHYDAATDTWTEPQLIETRSQDGSQPDVAVDDAGNALSVWLQKDADQEGVNSVWANYYSDGQWATPLLIEFSSGNADSPQVSVDPEGHFKVVWTQDDDQGVSHIWSNGYSPETLWGTATALEANDGAAVAPMLDLDSEGNAIAIWQQDDATGNDSIWVSRFVAGEGWQDPETIENGNGTAEAPYIAIDDEGNALAVWQQTDSDGTSIVANRFSMTPSTSADTTAPTVNSTKPLSGSGDIDASTSIEISFSENVQAGSLPASIFLLKNGDVVPASLAFDGLNTVTLTPDTDLDLGTRFTVEVGTGVRDLSGNLMQTEYRWSFTTVEAMWLGENLVDTSSEKVYFSDVAVDSDGNAIAIWNQEASASNPTTQIWTSVYQSGAWGAPARVDADPNYALAPQVAFDADGNGVAVWLQDNGLFSSNLWVNTYRNGTWGTAQEIDAGDGSAGEPHLLVLPNGKAYVTWAQADGDDSTGVFVSSYAPGGDWSAPEQVDNLGAQSAAANDPRIASDASGGLTVAWSQVIDGGVAEIWAARYTAGVGWGSARRIDSAPTGNALEVQVAMDAQGNSVAVWRQDDGNGVFSVWTNRFTVGTGWGTTATRLEQSGFDADDIRVVTDSNGKTVALWTQLNSAGKYDIWLASYTASTGWTSPTLIETRDGIAYSIDVSLSDDGRMAVVWHQDDGDGTYSIWASRYSDAFGWVDPVIISDADTGNATNPAVGINARGEAMAVWVRYEGDSGDLVANPFR